MSHKLPRLERSVDPCTPRKPAEHMAADAALLDKAAASHHSQMRIYTWFAPAVTYGYTIKESQLSGLQSFIGSRPTAQRPTGGGLVEHEPLDEKSHGEITFALAIPRAVIQQIPELRRASETYCWLHQRMGEALESFGIKTTLVPASTSPPAREKDAVSICFRDPVPGDILDANSGAKICGGAQRRTRLGLLHQGSIKVNGIEPAELAAAMAKSLS